jgi:hypothetical protein
VRCEDGIFLHTVCVPIMFPLMFPKFSMRSSRVFPIAPHFIPFPLPKVVPLLFLGAACQVSSFFGINGE